MGEQVEGLEHDADAAADLVGVDSGSGDVLAVEQDRARVDGVEQIDATEDGRLSAATGPDQAHDLVLVDG